MPETGDARYVQLVRELCDEMERIYRSRGCYVEITVQRQWSHHNPVISREIARPSAYRCYLERESCSSWSAKVPNSASVNLASGLV